MEADRGLMGGMATQLDDRSPWTDEAPSRHALRTYVGLVDDDTIDDADLNIGRLATTRHVAAGHGSATAIRWFGRDDTTTSSPIDITYEMLDHRTNRFAGGLRRHGIEAGAAVATIAERIPELYVAALGTLKAGCVYTPIFSALGVDSIADRLEIGGIKVVVTTPLLFRRTVAKMLDRLPDLELVLIVGATEDSLSNASRSGLGPVPTVMSFGVFIAEGHDTFDAPTTPPGTPALLHFTTGTSGAPDGVRHDHDAVTADLATAQADLGLHRDDVYWCTAEPGRITGTSYGIVAPLVSGAVSIVDEADFDAGRWYRILASEYVEIFLTSPAAISMLQRAGTASAHCEFDELRLVASVGKPLETNSFDWASRVFGVPVLEQPELL